MDWVKAGISIDSKIMKAGMYPRIYWHFRNQPKRKPEIYVGQANDFHERSVRPLWDMKNENTSQSNHYRAARQAKQCKAFVLAVASNSDLRIVIEQLAVMLFMSYVAVIKGYSTKIGTPEDHELPERGRCSDQVLQRGSVR